MRNRLAAIVPLLLAMAVTQSRAEDRALLIGINEYRDQRITPLGGCEDDVKAVKQVLSELVGLAPEQIRTLLTNEATAEGIRQAVESWLVAGTRPGDRVILFYSGHGSQKPDQNGDEKDGMDEILCPVDYNPQTQTPCVLDDEIGQWLNRMQGRNITVLIDACHSGTITKSIKGTLYGVETIETHNTVSKFIPLPKDIFWTQGRSQGPQVGRLKQDGRPLGEAAAGAGSGLVDESRDNYVLFTACSDHQRAEEIHVSIGEQRNRRGAFTWMLVRGLSKPADMNGDGRITNAELLQYIDQGLHDPQYDLSQTPEILARQALRNAPVFGRTFTMTGSGSVIGVEGGRVTINRGAQHDVKKGDVFTVSPTAGKTTGNTPGDSGAVGSIQIESMEQFLAMGKLIKGTAEPGQLIRRDIIPVTQGPLVVCLPRPGTNEGDRFADMVRDELKKSGGFVLSDDSRQADRLVKAEIDNGRLSTAIYHRYGTLRSRVQHDTPLEAAADVLKRLKGERLLNQLGSLRGSCGEFRISLSVDGKQDTFVVRKDPNACETIRFRVRADRPCHLTLLNIDSKGEIRLLLPNKWQMSSHIEAERDYTIPPSESKPFEVIPPAGRDVVLAIGTTQPLALEGVNTKSIEKEGYATLPDGEGAVRSLFRSLSHTRAFGAADSQAKQDVPDFLYEIPSAGWASAEIVVNTIEE